MCTDYTVSPPVMTNLNPGVCHVWQRGRGPSFVQKSVTTARTSTATTSTWDQATLLTRPSRAFSTPVIVMHLTHLLRRRLPRRGLPLPGVLRDACPTDRYRPSYCTRPLTVIDTTQHRGELSDHWIVSPSPIGAAVPTIHAQLITGTGAGFVHLPP